MRRTNQLPNSFVLNPRRPITSVGPVYSLSASKGEPVANNLFPERISRIRRGTTVTTLASVSHRYEEAGESQSSSKHASVCAREAKEAKGDWRSEDMTTSSRLSLD